MPIIEDSILVEAARSYKVNPAKAFARMIHYCAMDGFDAHQDIIKKAFDSDNQTGSRMLVETYTEYLILYMHLITRKIDEIYGPENISKIQNLLLPSIAENALSYYEGDVKFMTQTIMTIANDRERDYAKCKYWLPAKPDYSMRDMSSTQYVFQSKLESILSKKHNDPFIKMRIMTGCLKGLTSFFAYLNLDEWLKGLAMTLEIASYESVDLAPPGIKPLQHK